MLIKHSGNLFLECFVFRKLRLVLESSYLSEFSRKNWHDKIYFIIEINQTNNKEK